MSDTCTYLLGCLPDTVFISGMEIGTRPLAHGELKMTWASWNSYTARPGGPRDVYTKFGEARRYSCKGMTRNKNLTQNRNVDDGTDAKVTAGNNSIHVCKTKMII